MCMSRSCAVSVDNSGRTGMDGSHSAWGFRSSIWTFMSMLRILQRRDRHRAHLMADSDSKASPIPPTYIPSLSGRGRE